ncbi:hypothetical protein PPERSA_09060 [Pseudocohnilembus persalinus]|uniref:Uncharacterized protein n=1 Tax=Pseudocohnilembus persalinus TaxID=266149 RepID=A0A0V0QLA0_PSEPJ|nr:hypothetical protein PPERSA_09060 [Pseudocohnilembus persalinus]|eukprot:KRX02938.1 hypothetical protein PPERSA_09060 [Pseudocohnilembus persalinus]
MPQDNYSYLCQDNFQINNQQPMEMNIQRQNSISQQQKHYMNNFNQDIGFQEQNLGLCINKIDSIQQQFETPQLNFNSSFQQQQQQQQQQLPQQQDLNQYQNNVQNENQFFQQIPQNPQRQSSLFAGQMNEKFQIPQQKIEYNDNNNNIMKMDIGGNLLNENQFQGENFYQYQNQQQQQKQPMDIQRNPVQEYKQAKRTRKQKQKQGGKKRQTDQQKKIVQKVKKNLFRNFSRQFFDYLIDNWSNISNKLKKVLSSKQYTSFTHHLNQQQQKQIVTKQNFHKIFFPYKNKFVRQKAEENTNDSQTNLNKKIMRAIAFQFIKTEFLQTCLTSRISNWPIFYEQRYSIISLLSSNASLY